MIDVKKGATLAESGILGAPVMSVSTRYPTEEQ